MRTGRPKAPLVLTEAERATVESLATRARTRPHLARVRPATASHRDVQAVARPAPDREGPRHRRPLHESPRACRRAVRGREGANPGAGPRPAPAADAAGADRTPDARLRAPRHH